MDLQGKKITVHDMCLRDGMHPKRHQITVDEMVTVSKAMDEAGIPMIEVTHGDGLGGSSVNYGFPAASDEEYLTAVCKEMKNAKVSALLLPGIGTVDHTPVYPREVLTRALELRASAIVLIHNHPSGDPTPSRADIAVTAKIMEGAAPLGLSVHDHIIVSANTFTSLRGEGYL